MHESLIHECLKAYVCILYASPCAPLLVLWPGEVEGTSLAMAQGKASPVPAPAPMFRVSAVLRRYDADVPPTAVGACCGHALRPSMSVLHAVFCGDRTQWVVLSAIAAKNRVENAHVAPEDVSAASADGRRRHVGVIASEHRGHPEHGFRCWYWSSLALGHCQ